MAGIRYVRGDATAPQGAGRKLIAHVCNNRDGWGQGVRAGPVAALARAPGPVSALAPRAGRNDFELGAVQVIQVERHVWVANMISQHGMRTGSNGPPVRYDAIDRAVAVTVYDHD